VRSETVAGLGATPTPTCLEHSVSYGKQIKAIAQEWDDANTLASQTPRAALAQQIANLQAIRRKAQDLTPLDCTKAAHFALTNAMDETIQGYLAFLGQKPDDEVNRHFNNAKGFMTSYSTEILKLAAPAATPTP
jgi:hypothetical protein